MGDLGVDGMESSVNWMANQSNLWIFNYYLDFNSDSIINNCPAAEATTKLSGHDNGNDKSKNF